MVTLNCLLVAGRLIFVSVVERIGVSLQTVYFPCFVVCLGFGLLWILVVCLWGCICTGVGFYERLDVLIIGFVSCGLVLLSL